MLHSVNIVSGEQRSYPSVEAAASGDPFTISAIQAALRYESPCLGCKWSDQPFRSPEAMQPPVEEQAAVRQQQDELLDGNPQPSPSDTGFPLAVKSFGLAIQRVEEDGGDVPKGHYSLTRMLEASGSPSVELS